MAATACCAQTFNTPEVSSFKEEVFRPISYYTGQANISIPITKVQTSEITIPVSLTYVGGGGLRAANPYSTTGMGWRLSAGGAITRTKNGVCDETVSPGVPVLSGFFSLPGNSVTNNYVRNNVSSYVALDNLMNVPDQHFIPAVEYSPDVFSFSFLGYSGFFVMGYDGQFKIQSQDIVSIEKINAPWSWPGTGNCVGFKLIANDGTKFTFGSTSGSIEFSGGNGPGVPYQCNAWYLTNIESLNGRMINFKYVPNSSTFVYFKTSNVEMTTTACSPVILDNITFNGGRVVFTSSTITQQISDIPSYLSLINKVELQDANNKTVSSSIFSYSTESFQRYYMLDNVAIDNKKYSFGYYNRSGLPNASLALGTDYWGFYNGQNEVTSVGTGNVSSEWDMYLNPTVTYPLKSPSEESAKLGILTSITYPTGGIESYEYEANTYSNIAKQTLGGNSYIFSEEPKKTAGLRIAKITLGNQVRKYKYVNTFDPNKPDYNPATMSFIGFSSSGILYRMPGVPYFGRSVVNFLSIDGEPSIVYSKVVEFLSDKSYTEFTMRSPIDKPDLDNTQNTSYFSVVANKPAIFNTFPAVAFVASLGKNSTRSLERGQVSLIKVFDATNTLKKSTAYTYATDPNRYNQFVSSVQMTTTADQAMAQLGLELGLAYLPPNGLSFSVIHSYCIYTFPVYLEQEVETNFEGATVLQRTTQYQYNNQKLRSAIITNNSKGDVLRTSFKYPADINTGNYALMVGKNMLNYPVEQVQLINNSLTGGKLTTYKLNGSTYVPDKKYLLNLMSPTLEFSYSYFNGTVMDSHYATAPEVTYNSYNTYGNVTQATTKDGIVTSYLWDASTLYPMAQVKGASYSQISTLDGKSANYPSKTLYTSLTGLSPAALLNTYTYKPLIGIVSATDPQGRTTFYDYDDIDRLALIRDQDNNILKKYCYNYSGQVENSNFSLNTVQSKTFAKNNCTGCQAGSLVTYTVQPGSYSSTISQADADSKAWADVTANGQAYANTNGTCTAAVIASTTAYNSVSTKSFSFQFNNNCTLVNYNFTLNSDASNISFAGIPEGNYTVTISSSGNTVAYSYLINDQLVSGTSATITVDIMRPAIGSNQVRIY